MDGGSLLDTLNGAEELEELDLAAMVENVGVAEEPKKENTMIEADTVDDMFAAFDDDDEDTESAKLNSMQNRTGTLVRICKADSITGVDAPIEVMYLAHGVVSRMSELEKLVIQAQLAQYLSPEASGAYSDGMIEDMKREVTANFRIIIDKTPTDAELISAAEFNKTFRQYIGNDDIEFL